MDPLRESDPRHIGAYRLLGRLGEGGMGSVFLAQSPRGRTVAVKLVRSDLAEQADFRKRFEREVRAARQVGGAWTAPVLDAETGADQPWLATGYLPGIPLNDAVDGQPDPLPERTVRILANRLALALGSVHGAGLIHRDVKPSNILVTIDGPRLIDFGIARALESGDDTQLTRTGAVVGSPAFMSPEQARGRKLTGASDIFSLGSALVFAATGRAPFGDTGLAAHGMLFSVAEDEPRLTGVPDGLTELLTDCLAKDPAARPGLADIAARTADPEDEPGPGGQAGNAAEPWLPAGLVAQLGRHTARLLDAEVPGAREAADRAADADGMPPDRPEPSPVESGPWDAESAAPRAESAPFRLEPEPLPVEALALPEGVAPFRIEPESLGGEPEPPSGERAAPPSRSTSEGGAGQGPGQGQGQGQGQDEGQGPQQAEGQERRKRRSSRRRRAVAGTVVALALVAGGGALLADRGTTASGGQGKEDGEAADPSEHPRDAPSVQPSGAVSERYTGTWQTDVKKRTASLEGDSDRVLSYRMEIRKGDKGDVVAKTVSVYNQKMCEGEGTLVPDKRGEDRVKIRTRTTKRYTDDAEPCASSTRLELNLRKGALLWSMPEEDEEGQLHPVTDSGTKALPDAMVGEWEPADAEGFGPGARFSFRQGPVGTAVMRYIGKVQGEDCVTEFTLGAADDGLLLFGGLTPEKKGCRDEIAMPHVARMHGDNELQVQHSWLLDNDPETFKRVG